MAKTHEERFMSKVEKGKGKNAHWTWTGARFKNATGEPAQGCIGEGGKNWLAHRFAMQFLKGEDVEGKKVVRTCNESLCVNPAHLAVEGELSDKMRRKGVAPKKKAPAKPAAKGKAKFTDDQVRSIRSATGTAKVLAKKFGCSESAIRDIQKGKTYKNVSAETEDDL